MRRLFASLVVLLIATVSAVAANAADLRPRGTAADVAIHAIQGSGDVSPLVGSSVTTRGVVTALKSNGFFLQEPDASADSDPGTSEGIFVFTSSAPSATVGDLASVTGTVQEFVPPSDPASAPMTEISTPAVQVISTGNPLPNPIVLTTADSGNLERFEGMRVTATLDVAGPTSGSVNETNATSTSNGVFYGVIHGVARPFREPGINISDTVPSPAPPNVPRFDENFERIRVDSDSAGSTPPRTALNVSFGESVTMTGPIEFAYRVYNIVPDAGASTVTGAPASRAASGAASDEFTLATANLERFYNDVNDPDLSAGNQPVLTAAAFGSRLKKASLAVRNYLGAPDILALEEIENLAALTSLANAINGDAVAAGQPDPKYVPYLVEGNDVGGIDVGFLTRSAAVAGGLPRVEVVSVAQQNKNETYIDPNSGQPAILNDRPPLVLRAVVHFAGGTSFPVTVIGNHLRSLSGVEDDARVRAKRAAQAESLALLVEQLQSAGERVVVAGDFNAFEFNDGYVDVIGTIKGTPAPADQVVRSSNDLVNPDLIDLDQLVPANERYSYNFDGNAQALDHILVTQSLKAALGGIRFDHARINSDLPETFRNDPATPFRISDHDPTIAYFALPRPAPARRRAAAK